MTADPRHRCLACRKPDHMASVPPFLCLSCEEKQRAGTLERWWSTELTPAGEQTVIPGCERNLRARPATQLDLFG